MTTVIACMQCNLQLSDYVSATKLAGIMHIDEDEARLIMSGESALDWNELMKIAAYFEIDMTDITFTPAENAHTNVYV